MSLTQKALTRRLDYCQLSPMSMRSPCLMRSVQRRVRYERRIFLWPRAEGRHGAAVDLNQQWNGSVTIPPLVLYGLHDNAFSVNVDTVRRNCTATWTRKQVMKRQMRSNSRAGLGMSIKGSVHSKQCVSYFFHFVIKEVLTKVTSRPVGLSAGTVRRIEEEGRYSPCHRSYSKLLGRFSQIKQRSIDPHENYHETQFHWLRCETDNVPAVTGQEKGRQIGWSRTLQFDIIDFRLSSTKC